MRKEMREQRREIRDEKREQPAETGKKKSCFAYFIPAGKKKETRKKKKREKLPARRKYAD